MIGKTISHFKIIEKLGEGGMGVVYKAEDTKLERSVALKFLSPKTLGSEEERARFVQEAKAAASLSHPNITTVYSIDEIGDKTFIVMEYVDGQELKHRIDKGPLDLKDALQIAAQLADGLRAAHDRGIVHRDIKSSNVVVTPGGQAKIMDFGIAKLSGSSQITTSSSTVGTIAYMSPEQIQGALVDHRTDLWSLGIVIYEMLTGKRPFMGDYDAAVIYQVLNENPRPVMSVRPDVPGYISSLVSRLLQKDPGNRAQSAGEVINLLRSDPPKPASQLGKKSVAVLYFENMSSEKENEYFCAGMTEDLITDLSKIRGLRVIPRSDVQPLRNREVNARQVGESLGVDYILEGSVRKAGSKIRITSQLIDVEDGFQVWAERYDRLMEDVFDVQVEVSENIAEALKVSLTDSEKESLAKKPTDDVRAYDFYLRGSEFLSGRGRADRQTAIKMFEHALEIDPEFALAYVGLAEAYYWNYLFLSGDRIWLEKMMDANEMALSLDPGLVEAQVGVGIVLTHQRRLSEAARCFEEIVEKKEDFYPAYFWLSIVSNVIGDLDAAIEYGEMAAAKKPYSEEPWHHLDATYRRKGDIEGSKRAGDKVIELGERRLSVNPDEPITITRVAVTYASRGDKQKAMELVDRAQQIGSNDGMALYNCASVYSLLGMHDEALDLFERATEAGMIIIDWIHYDPFIDPLRDKPKFRELMSRYDQ